MVPVRSFALVMALAAAAAAEAVEPIRLGGLSLSLGGEASQSLAERDLGYFNDTGYERNPLRLFRLSVSAELRAGERLAALAEVRSENLDEPRAYALYLRLRPWPERGFDVQAGLIPPVFGAYARRRYGPDNPLIGEPLAYQYLTTLRADALPATPDGLLAWQGGGWDVWHPIGDPFPAPGLPLVSAVRWDAGVQAHWATERLEASVAVTQGTLSRPRVEDDNGGKQLSARLSSRPVTGLVVGASVAQGEYLTDGVRAGLPVATDRRRQRAFGLDAEYSAGHALVRLEAVWSAWEVPTLWSAAGNGPLRAAAASIEGRYTLRPGLYAAARADHLAFSRLLGSTGWRSWDAAVTRLEAGLGLSLRRGLLLKAVWQHNQRDGGQVRRRHFAAGQVLWWF